MPGPGIDLTRRSFVGLLIAAAAAPKTLAAYTPPPEPQILPPAPKIEPAVLRRVCPGGFKIEFRVKGEEEWLELPACFEIRHEPEMATIVWGDRPYHRPLTSRQHVSLRIAGIAFPDDIFFDMTPVQFRYAVDDVWLESGWMRAVGMQKTFSAYEAVQEVEFVSE